MTASPDKIPMPHNPEAERALLGSMIMDNAQIDVALDFLPRVPAPRRGRKEQPPEPLFYTPANQIVWEAVSALHAERRPIDLTVLAGRLREAGFLDAAGGPEYLAHLEDDIFSLSQVPEYARIVASHWRRRTIIRACRETALAASQMASLEDVLAMAERQIIGAGMDGAKGGYHALGDILIDELQSIEEERAGRRPPGLMTGILTLDRMIMGFRPPQFVVVAARPSVGKSAFVDQIALGVASLSGRTVAVNSLEMGKSEIVRRQLSRSATVSHEKIKDGRNLARHELDALHRDAEKLARVKLLIDDEPGLTGTIFCAKARRLKALHPDLAMIAVDYLQLMKGGRKDGDRRLEIEEISASLKCLCKELDIFIIACVQMNRKFEERLVQYEKDKAANKKNLPQRPEPSMADIREAGGIEQDADIIIFIDRDVSGDDITTWCKVAKFRGGRPCKFKLGFVGEYTQFVELANQD